MAYLRGLTNGPRTYTSVQNGRGPEDNINLNSDLEFSCVIGRPSNATWLADIAHTQYSIFSQPFLRAQCYF